MNELDNKDRQIFILKLADDFLKGLSIQHFKFSGINNL